MFGDLAWSPDSRWLACVEGRRIFSSRIVLFEAATGRKLELTNDRVDSYNPAWSPDGKWLYFLSDRYFQSAVGSPGERGSLNPILTRRPRSMPPR